MFEKEEYSSLEEIGIKYIHPVNQMVRLITQHGKFKDSEVEEICKVLQEEKQRDPGKIPYYICFNEEMPQYAILCYIYHRQKLRFESVKIKPEHLQFHSQSFFNLDQVIQFFKQNLQKNEYQQYYQQLPELKFQKKLTELKPNSQQKQIRKKPYFQK